MTALKILVVDDNFQDVILFRSVLKKAAVHLPFRIVCDETNSGVEARNLISAGHYDMVFLDQQMPDQDGLVCFDSICQIKWPVGTKRPAIIAYSNCDLSEFRARCLRAGMDAFFVKYLSENELLALIGKYYVDKLPSLIGLTQNCAG